MVHVQFKIDNMNMKKYKLGDLLSEFHAGKAIQTENVKNKGAYPVYGGNGQRGYTDSYNQDGEYLIIGRQGAYCGNVRYNIGKAYLTEHAIVGQAKENHNPIYIALKLSLMKLSQLQGQSAQPGLSVNTLSCISMEMHPKEIQDKIADIMLKLDRKIELNKQINDNLEAMAKQLYDYWFVQFDFPNEEGKPYKSSGGAMVWNENLKREIPQGWVVEKMGKCTNVLLGGTPDTNDNSLWGNGYNWLNSGEVAEFPILKSEKNITPKGLEKSATVLAPKGSVTLSITRHLRPSILCIDACINQSVVAILENDKISKEYIYPLLNRDIPRLMSLRTGAQQPHINKETVEAINVVLPPANIMGAYINKAESIYNAIFNNAKEVEELTKQRDELLPLLMNGQASVNSD